MGMARSERMGKRSLQSNWHKAHSLFSRMGQGHMSPKSCGRGLFHMMGQGGGMAHYKDVKAPSIAHAMGQGGKGGKH
jgi:hypothetical protein